MPEVLGAIILGAIQGITEFLPISSTAHLVLVPWLFQWESPLLDSLTFDVALHMGTLLATLGYFARDWVRLIGAWLSSVRGFIGRDKNQARDDPWAKTAWLVLLGTVPAAAAGALLEDQVETAFRSPLLIAGTLSIVGLLLALAEKLGRKSWGLHGLSARGALAIGLGQAAALVPGVSRSGGTMAVALFLGMQREPAARYSFLMAAPIMAGAGLKKLPEMATSFSTDAGLMATAAGFLTSATVGYLCIKYLLRYLERGTLYVFAVYRIAVALIVLAAIVLAGRPAG